jgi:hypothetical protein
MKNQTSPSGPVTILVLLCGFLKYYGVREKMENPQIKILDPLVFAHFYCGIILFIMILTVR